MEEKNKSGFISSFDQEAASYDVDFTYTAVGRLQRQRVYHFLEKSLSNKPLQILEINCGTGEDATWLTRRGNHVTATDISVRMIEVTKSKIEKHQLQHLVTAHRCSFSELKENFQPQSFDLVFSNFGGLNCIDSSQLKTLAADLELLLKHGGSVVAVIMSTGCWWERFYYFSKGKKKEAGRRTTGNAVTANLEHGMQSTWYYSPADIRRIFSPAFKVVGTAPIGIFIPPSYLNSFFTRKKTALKILSQLESIFPFSFLSYAADHFYIELKKIS
jgi:ubiquinone/menaquinone biosynthesis C-methylase UbiE